MCTTVKIKYSIYMHIDRQILLFIDVAKYVRVATLNTEYFSNMA